MPIQRQSSFRAHRSHTSKESLKNKQKTEKSKKTEKIQKTDESKSQISKESWSTTSIKDRIFCILFCCCKYGKST